jgi:hypothetical protein
VVIPAYGIGRRRYGRATLGVAAVLLSGCGAAGSAGTTSVPPTVAGSGPRPAEVVGSGAGCPGGLGRLVDTETPVSAETILGLDFSGSFINGEPARARMHAQVRSLVEQSVERGQALRVLAFARAASGASTIVSCPSLAARYNNAAARPRKVENLKRKATAAVDAALEAAIQARTAQGQGRGTSIVGGFLAIEESAPLVRPGTPRDAVMFSDGQGLDEDAGVDLSGFRTVSLYGVGANAGGPMDTPAAAAAAERWARWLTAHGARSPNVSTQAMF